MEETMSQNYPRHRAHLVVKIIGMILITAIVGLAILRDRFVANPQWQVSVVGRGELTYTPDIAKINIGAKVDRAVTAEAALKQLNDNMAKVVKAIIDAGIDKKDVQTLNYNLYPQYDWITAPLTPDSSVQPSGKNILTGYNADQSLVVTIKNLGEENANVSKVIAAAGKAGSNQINSISFESSDMNNLKEQARLKAIADAKSKSAELSQAAGVKLGKIVGWWENMIQGAEAYNSYYGGKGGATMSADVTAPTIPTGEYKLIMEMNLNYEVK
ncbi:MAG: hypothetical protein C3F02_01040 [Parcubacteria group bacterium]|nr:MAG: hypothetical protein C3F02_01040 [Parcubacteria group bacterium]